MGKLDIHIQWYSMVFVEICRDSTVFNGIRRDPMVFNGIRRYSMVFNDIRWDSMVFIEIQWYLMVFDGIQWYLTVFDGIQWYRRYWMVFHGCPVIHQQHQNRSRFGASSRCWTVLSVECCTKLARCSGGVMAPLGNCKQASKGIK